MSKQAPTGRIEPKHPIESVGDPDPSVVANEVLKDLSLVVHKSDKRENPTVKTFLIQFHYDVGPTVAKRAKTLLLSHLSDEDLEDAA